MGKDKLQPPNTDQEENVFPNFSELIQQHIEYHEYLDNFGNRPPLTECTGPMSLDEWIEHQTKVANILKIINKLSKPES